MSVSKQSDKVVIFDTTLRDGEQSPGASLTHREKLELARYLAMLNVDEEHAIPGTEIAAFSEEFREQLQAIK